MCQFNTNVYRKSHAEAIINIIRWQENTRENENCRKGGQRTRHQAYISKIRSLRTNRFLDHFRPKTPATGSHVGAIKSRRLDSDSGGFEQKRRRERWQKEREREKKKKGTRRGGAREKEKNSPTVGVTLSGTSVSPSLRNPGRTLRPVH